MFALAYLYHIKEANAVANSDQAAIVVGMAQADLEAEEGGLEDSEDLVVEDWEVDYLEVVE